MENIIHSIKTNIAFCQTKLDELNQQIQKLNIELPVSSEYNKDNSYLVDILITHSKSSGDRNRVTRQDVFFPKNLFEITYSATEQEMFDYIVKNSISLKNIKINEVHEKIIGLIYNELKHKEDNPVSFDKTRLKDFIRSLDPKFEYYKDLTSYVIRKIIISGNKGNGVLLNHATYTSCTFKINECLENLLAQKWNVVIKIDMR